MARENSSIPPTTTFGDFKRPGRLKKWYQMTRSCQYFFLSVASEPGCQDSEARRRNRIASVMCPFGSGAPLL